jgi:transposase
MEKIIRIGIDTSKQVFQLHGVNSSEQVVLRKKLRRSEMETFFEKLPPTLIGMEACGASHHWARLLSSFGHQVRLMPPQYVKPYVQRGKNDAADAEAICEAMSRPKMRFVPVKSVDQQAALMLLSVRKGLVERRTQLANEIRGHASEFGLIAAKGINKLGALLQRIALDMSLAEEARELFGLLGGQYRRVEEDLAEVEAKLRAWHRNNEMSRRLAKVPGIGEVVASMLVMKTPKPEVFRSGRRFAAWIGLTPADHSSGGKQKLGGITRAGDEALRTVLICGATAVIRHVLSGHSKNASPWLKDLLKRKPPKLAAVALANKMARIAWKLMVSGQTYRPTTTAGASAMP